MVIDTQVVDLQRDDARSEAIWKELYPSLLSFARYFVFSLNVSSWYGQEEDIIQDVAQETVRRLLECLQKAERGERPPIQSLKSMMIVIAQNYCRDMNRHDRRISRTAFGTPEAPDHEENDLATLTDVVVENVFQESLFLLLAQEIARFPRKLGQALLIDLASRMAFEEEPTTLQRAFLEVGIQLQDYQNRLSDHPRDRKNHAALLHYAYKRIAQLRLAQEYAYYA